MRSAVTVLLTCIVVVGGGADGAAAPASERPAAPSPTVAGSAVPAAGGSVAPAQGAVPALPPEPGGPHPRMLLDGALRAAWRADAAARRGPVAAASALCGEARPGGKYDAAGYEGWAWATALQACLVAWAATDAPEASAFSAITRLTKSCWPPLSKKPLTAR